MSGLHDHYHIHRRKRYAAHSHEHPVTDKHQYIYRTWPIDSDFHPRPTLEVSDYCPPTNLIDAELVFALKQSIAEAKRKKGIE